MWESWPFVKNILLMFYFKAQEIAVSEKALQVRAEVEENNPKRRKIEREAIQVIVLKVPQNQERRRKATEERNRLQVQDQDQEVPHEKQSLKNLY